MKANTQPKAVYFLGLLGWPLRVSLSPRLHLSALRAAGLDGDYSLFPIPPGTDGLTQLKDRLEWVKKDRLQGLNVTIPHKQTVIQYLDELTPVAEATGAVNTIYQQGERLVGDNTDAPGFQTDLERVTGWQSTPEGNGSDGKHAIILGAGGSARAAAYSLAQKGWRVSVAARKIEQADALVAQISSWAPGLLESIPLEKGSLRDISGDADLVVNTTPLGMSPNPGACPWPEGVPFPKGCVIYDLVYEPRETLLVKLARGAGLRAFNGLGMLVEQAALAFERWTGVTASREAMRRAVMNEEKETLH